MFDNLAEKEGRTGLNYSSPILINFKLNSRIALVRTKILVLADPVIFRDIMFNFFRQSQKWTKTRIKLSIIIDVSSRINE